MLIVPIVSLVLVTYGMLRLVVVGSSLLTGGIVWIFLILLLLIVCPLIIDKR
jgi:hypothetical protein